MAYLEAKQLRLGHDRQAISAPIDIQMEQGEIFALLGPSGTGKTTLLKTLCGLIPPYSGTLHLAGRNLATVPTEKRNIVLIFQQPLLFPHMSVRGNISFGLRMQKKASHTAAQKIEEIIALTELQGLEEYRPDMLSGGQQQRVALARALVVNPALLLLDEPFAALDPALRLRMRNLLLDIRAQTGTTMIFVTHDQSEALHIADTVSVLLDGKQQQSADPHTIFHRPANEDVARFFGCNTILPGLYEQGCFHLNLAGNRSVFTLPLPVSSLPSFPPCQGHGSSTRIPCKALVRPEAWTIHQRPEQGLIQAQIHAVRFEGSFFALKTWLVKPGKQEPTNKTSKTSPSLELDILVPSRPSSTKADWHPGQEIGLSISPEHLHILPHV